MAHDGFGTYHSFIPNIFISLYYSFAFTCRFASGQSPHFALAPLHAPAELHIHSAAFPSAAPAVLTLGSRTRTVGDFDFMDDTRTRVVDGAGAGTGAEAEEVVVVRGPRVAAGVGRDVVVFYLGEE
jgi:hypothetical protein